MILIADGGSTKADWIAINSKKEEAFRVRTLGLNPAVVPEVELENRIVNMFQLMQIKEEVTEIFFLRCWLWNAHSYGNFEKHLGKNLC